MDAFWVSLNFGNLGPEAPMQWNYTPSTKFLLQFQQHLVGRAWILNDLHHTGDAPQYIAWENITPKFNITWNLKDVCVCVFEYAKQAEFLNFSCLGTGDWAI